jgi:hypothetical protein
MWLCGPLHGVWADVSAAAGDSADPAFIAEELDSPRYRVPAYVVFLLELFHRRQRAVSPLAIGDPRPEDGG